MKVIVSCTTCAKPLHAVPPTKTGPPHETQFCPSCGLLIAGKDRPYPAIEREPFFYIHVEWTGSISVAQVKVLRVIDTSLGAKSATLALQELRHSSAIIVGPWYSKPEADRAMQQLRLAGLTVDLQLKWEE